MTQTMLERAARAVCELHGGDYWDKAAPYERGRYRDVARAVLMAVREPDEAMSQAVRTTEGWEDMIDFVLSETAQPSPPPRV